MGFIKRIFNHLKAKLKDERGFIEFLPAIIAGANAIFGDNDGGGGGGQQQQGPQITTVDPRTPEQRQIQQFLARLLTEGAAPFTGERIAGLTGGEQQIQGFLTNALTTAQPGINRLLSGEFPEQFFQQSIQDPARRQLREDVLPNLREQFEATGNRFSDRLAIAEGRAVGDVENALIQERGNIGLQTLRDPINTLSALSGALGNLQNVASVPRSIAQAQLDFDYERALLENPELGGLIQSMLSFTAQGSAEPTIDVQRPSALNQFVGGGGFGLFGGGGGGTGSVIAQTLQGLGGGGGGGNSNQQLLNSLIPILVNAFG